MSASFVGDFVTKGAGLARGIITEPPRKAGIYKGRVTVMWVGGRYEVTEWPDDLTEVPLPGVTR